MTSSVGTDYARQYHDFVDGALFGFVDQMGELMDACGPQARYFFAGNGASAAIASHLANDFAKALRLKATTFHDPALLTCFANDYGYEQWVARALELYGSPGDIAVLISSSGRSPNIVNGGAAAKAMGMRTVLLTGPTPDVGLECSSDVVLKVSSDLYNIIECCHMMALCAVVDSRHLARLSQ